MKKLYLAFLISLLIHILFLFNYKTEEKSHNEEPKEIEKTETKKKKTEIQCALSRFVPFSSDLLSFKLLDLPKARSLFFLKNTKKSPIANWGL